MFVVTEHWKWPECSTTCEKLNNIYYSLTIKYYSVIKINDINLFACTDLERGHTLIKKKTRKKPKQPKATLSLLWFNFWKKIQKKGIPYMCMKTCVCEKEKEKEKDTHLIVSAGFLKGEIKVGQRFEPAEWRVHYSFSLSRISCDYKYGLFL